MEGNPRVTILFLYVLAASSDPDNVECLVPYLVDDEEIFFGPCKRLLRKELRARYLGASDDVHLKEDVFVVGVNGSNRERCRKIVWAGRITRLMTFEVAYRELIGPRYLEMRDRKDSPLHLRPVYDSTGEFKGYERRSSMHAPKHEWVKDLTHSSAPYVKREGKKLLLVPGADRCQAFSRDCCFLLENVFFAQGTGVDITGGILAVLKEAQHSAEDIDEYAIFGHRADGSADGRTGRWLEMQGEGAKELVRLIGSAVSASKETPRGVRKRRLKSCSCR